MTLIKKEDKGYILFRDLPENAAPIVALPDDSAADLVYNQQFQEKCSICNSPWRTRAEHVYLENGKKVMPVIKFFERHFNARLNHTQVATHMDNHCIFRNVSVSGLLNYEHQEEMVAPWKFREFDLALTAMLVELDDIRGMDVNRNKDMLMKRATLVEKLIARIIDIKSRRDDAALNAINIFEVLSELHDSMEVPGDKQRIRDKVKELRLKLSTQNG